MPRVWGTLESAVSDLPFKLGPQRIVILKNLPVLQCESCGEYLLEDPSWKQSSACWPRSIRTRSLRS